MVYDANGVRGRIAVVASVAALHGMALVYLLSMRAMPLTVPESAVLILFDVEPVTPIPPEPHAAAPAHRARPDYGLASPANLNTHPTAVVTPPRVMTLPVLSPVVAAPIASVGPDAMAGASDLPGPGTGSGGEGVGLGSGARVGGVDGGGTRARRIAGAITDADYPSAARKTSSGGTVIVHLDIDARGRVGACRLAASSGDTVLDETTCRLIQRRFRYHPAVDPSGRAIGDVVGWKQIWWLEPRR